ncbi:hypothetical protein BGZ65_004904 [Modicella reniformis]|uniref:PROP1-like PPR domain-containing protein n=1 Tax=Modicella reniformis TaxID=1440133 RepID=A0A9P6M3F0_9FUNG|nr:hypothetical protein BGZ65_004904 [Modicella reniformis]
MRAKRFLHSNKPSKRSSFSQSGDGISLEEKGSIVAELRQKALVKANAPQLWTAYSKVVQSEALPLLQSDDVIVLFQALLRYHQIEQSTEMMLQVALDVDDIGKQLPQDAYDILVRQLAGQLPTEQIKAVLWQVQGRRRFVTELIQLCDSNTEIRRVLELYNKLIKESFDVDGFSTYFQSRKQRADSLGEMVLQWMYEEGKGVNTRIVESLLVFLLDRWIIDKVYNAIAKLARGDYMFSCNFYTTAIHRFGLSERFDYMNMTLDLMRRQGLEPLGDTYSAIIDAHSKAGNLREAQFTYQHILASGLTPTDMTLGPMLEAVGKMGDHDMTRQLVEQMNASGISSNEYTFSSLLQSLSNDPDASVGLFEELSKQVEPNTVNYNMLIRTFQRHNDLDGAFRVFRSMVASGVQPDRYTFSSILSLFAARGDTEGAEVFWNEMVDVHKVVPNSHAYGSMMHVYCTAEDMVSAQTVYRKMIRASIMPNEVIFGTLLNAYARRGDLTQMLSIYDAMRAEGLKPNSYIYANLLFGLVKDGDMTAARRMFENMQEDGYGYNVLAQTILMKGYLDQGDFKESQEVYKNMLSNGMIPNYMTYATLLHAHAKRGEIKEGRAFLDKILKSRGLVMMDDEDETLDGNESQDRARTASAEGANQGPISNVFQEGHLSTIGTERKPLKIPSRPKLLVAYAPLLDAYAKESNILATEGMFKEIRDRGLEPNTITYTILMDGYRRAQDVESVLRIWNELFSRFQQQWKYFLSYPERHRPSKVPVVEWVQDRLSTKGSKLQRLMQRPVSITLDTLCYSGRVQEAKAIWRQLEMIGFDFDSSNWNDYCIALARNGLLLDAFRIVQDKLLPGFVSEQELIHSSRSKDSQSSGAHLSEDESFRPDTENEGIASPTVKQPVTLLYPRPRTFAALADGLEELLSPKDDDSRVQYRDQLADPIIVAPEDAAGFHAKVGQGSPGLRAKRLEKQKRLIEAKLRSYPHPFEDMSDTHCQILWSIIRTEFPKVLEALNEGMLVASGSLNSQTTTLEPAASALSEDEDGKRVSNTSGRSSKSSRDQSTAATRPPGFKGFRLWRRLKWVIKDIERKKFLEDRSIYSQERDPRLDLPRGRKLT